ncbi:MAG: hypothetical protein K8S13_08250 [Desulfobacula sp.]|uniref:hypothetical protein n=1 Tax=Desulfobacula sp. TaxID=2593537 RepID=UPI0025C2AAFF|nr:hypothetical protein [Desulfobacula sp.]MCD4719838.1 hypothetical protein [Desulfobacula sp.]
MTKKITRRQFLQKGTSKATLLAIANTGLVLSPAFAFKIIDVRCKNCKVINTNLESHFFLMGLAERESCSNCGSNFITRKISISCNNCVGCYPDNTNNNFSGCWQIPFPNHNYLRNSKKPNFSLKGIKF